MQMTFDLFGAEPVQFDTGYRSEPMATGKFAHVAKAGSSPVRSTETDCTLVFGRIEDPMTRRATFVSQVHATLIQVRVNGKLETVNAACVRRDQ